MNAHAPTEPGRPDAAVESDGLRRLRPARSAIERWRRFLDPDVRSRLSPGADPIARALVFVFPDGEIDRAEWWFAWALLLWGVWLALPFDVYASAPSLYAEMAAVGSEGAWSVWYVGGGAVYLAALLAERFGRAPLPVWTGRAGRFVAAFVATVLWTFVAIAITHADWRSTGTPVYAQLLTTYSGWTLTRLVVHRGAVPSPW